MKPSAFVRLISEQLHYQPSSALQEYLRSIDTVYKRTGSFLETETAHPTAVASLSTADLGFIQFSEKEYHARAKLLANSQNKRIRIAIGDAYWNALVSIRSGDVDTQALSANPHVEMKTSLSQTQFNATLTKLLELKYVFLSKQNKLLLTKKGISVLAKLGHQQHGLERIAESSQLTPDDNHRIDPVTEGVNECEVKLMLDCRGEGSYARLLPQDIAQYTSIVKLPRGDCLVLANDQPVALIERKTITDLSASFYDGRIQRQLDSSARFPTFLLVEDPQLLLIHEDQLLQAVLAEVDKGSVSSVIQSAGAKHTAHIYECLFRSASDPSQRQYTCHSDGANSDFLLTPHPSGCDDWYCFIKNILCNHPPNVAEAVVRVYPCYKSLVLETPSALQQHLLAMGIPREAITHIIELLPY